MKRTNTALIVLVITLVISGAIYSKTFSETNKGTLRDTLKGTLAGTPKGTLVKSSVAQEKRAPDRALLKLQKMTLEQKVGQMFLVSVFSEDPKAIDKLISERKIGSVILMGKDIKNKKVIDITKKLQKIASTTKQIPLFISTDQEGGIVARIKDKDSILTAQPEIKDASQAYKVALERGKELRRKGVNVNFSPVLENITATSSFLYKRVFRGTNENIISLGSSMVKGYRDAGIIPVVKHFPGHDDSSVDSHKDLPVSQIEKVDLPKFILPFTEVIKKENPAMIMMGHLFFPKIDPVYPATLSLVFIDLLRKEYGYNGVIITDDMNMGAITKNFGVKDSALQAIRAGNDLLLYVASDKDIKLAYDSVLSAVRVGDISEERINSSVYRILKLKQSLNLF